MIHRQILHTEKAIDLVKETFTHQLKSALKLTKVSAPIASLDGTGINDDLNGIERPVKFPVKALGDEQAVVVHSLAKWKRLRLAQLDVPVGEGIVTDMRALRPDEDFTPLHSIYVDQWDWEQVMPPERRTVDFLRQTVEKIYEVLKATEQTIAAAFPDVPAVLPDEITFITAEELLQNYPRLSVKERESAFAKEHGAIFIMGIGGELSTGEPHDGRAPDYDDWSTKHAQGKGLNGDIVVWHPVLEQAFELSSMGIRVDAEALKEQLRIRGCEERASLDFHKRLLSGELPQSIGGGIGQSRMAMFMLKKKHIGEVQVGLWSDEVVEMMKAQGVELL